MEILLLVYCPGSCSLIYSDLSPNVYQTIALTVFIWVFVGENCLNISSRKEYILLLDCLYFHIFRLLWIEAFISCLISWSFNLKPIRGTRFEFSNVEYCWSEKKKKNLTLLHFLSIILHKNNFFTLACQFHFLNPNKVGIKFQERNLK